MTDRRLVGIPKTIIPYYMPYPVNMYINLETISLWKKFTRLIDVQ